MQEKASDYGFLAELIRRRVIKVLALYGGAAWVLIELITAMTEAWGWPLEVTRVALLSFIFTYNDFILANVLLKTTTQYPLTVGLYNFTSGQFAQQWGVFAAGALMGAVPIVIVYLMLQDYIVGGLTQGAVKG